MYHYETYFSVLIFCRPVPPDWLITLDDQVSSLHHVWLCITCTYQAIYISGYMQHNVCHFPSTGGTQDLWLMQQVWCLSTSGMMMEKFMTLLHCTRMHRTQCALHTCVYYFAFDLFICYAVFVGRFLCYTVRMNKYAAVDCWLARNMKSPGITACVA